MAFAHTETLMLGLRCASSSSAISFYRQPRRRTFSFICRFFTIPGDSFWASPLRLARFADIFRRMIVDADDSIVAYHSHRTARSFPPAYVILRCARRFSRAAFVGVLPEHIVCKYHASLGMAFHLGDAAFFCYVNFSVFGAHTRDFSMRASANKHFSRLGESASLKDGDYISLRVTVLGLHAMLSPNYHGPCRHKNVMLSDFCFCYPFGRRPGHECTYTLSMA